MKKLSRENFPGAAYTSRILQFGEGNFIRAFIGAQIEQLNRLTPLDAGITIVRRNKPAGKPDLNNQDGLYSVISRGVDDDGERCEQSLLIRSVNRVISINQEYDEYLATAEDPNYRFIFSNTTELGITFDESCRLNDQPADSFPAKLTQWLYRRFVTFNGDANKGVIVFPCELLDKNGDKLKEFVLTHARRWLLPIKFTQWLLEHNTFCNTLVDQIVTGFPDENSEHLEKKLGYHDPFMVACELYYEFAIDGPASFQQELHLDALKLNIKWVPDVTPYAERKIAILNGSHSAMVPLAILAGFNTVRGAMDDTTIMAYTEALQSQEIIPQLSLPEDELQAFKKRVFNRFSNPFIEHQLMAITLNSLSKFRTRLVPQVFKYYQRCQLPPVFLSVAFAAQILLYKGAINGEPINLIDDADGLKSIQTEWKRYTSASISLVTLVQKILGNESLWQCDLNVLDGWSKSVANDLESLIAMGPIETLSNRLK